MKITTTLNRLKKAGACTERYEVLLKALGGTKADHDAPIDALFILHNNGVSDVMWLLCSSACSGDTVSARAEYDRVIAQARAEYDRVITLGLEKIFS